MNAFLLDVMVALMPFMKPLLWLGVLAAGAGVALLFAKTYIDEGLRHKGLLWSGRIAAGLGLFFIACQGMGATLGAMPAFNLGDTSKFEFIMVPFWQPGLALFLAAIAVGNGLANAKA